MADMRLDGKIAATCCNIGGINTAHSHKHVGGVREAIQIAGFIHMAVVIRPFRATCAGRFNRLL